jgi:response regulator NasT
MSEFSAILIAGRLIDDASLDLALDLAHDGCNGIMVVTERSELFDAHEMLDGTGVTILSKPLTKDALLQAIKLILKVGESGGTVEKAKLMLMQHKNFTEPQAHRYIQKLSMDKRLPREVAAQYILKAIERELGGAK